MSALSKNINRILPAETLLYIFSILSSDANDNIQCRLTITIIATHVCQQWRYLLLEAAFIWGKLLVFDSDDGITTEPLLFEIIERSKTSPLWIESSRFPTPKDSRELLFQLLPSLWERMARIKWILVGVGQEEFESRYIPLLVRQAPLLEQFDIRERFGEHLDLASAFQWNSLFSNQAPKLRHMATTFHSLSISINAPWLFNLTSLETGRRTVFTRSLDETLSILSRMPQLTSLILAHPISEDISSLEQLSNYPIVNLIHLTYMAISGTLSVCHVLVDRIRSSASGCLVNFKADIVSSILSPKLMLISLFDNLMEANIRYLNGSNPLDWLFLSIELSTVRIGSRGVYSHKSELEELFQTSHMSSSGISMEFSVARAYISETVPAMRTVFQSPPFQNITTLRLNCDTRIFSIYHSLFSVFTSVITLEISLDTMRYLEEHSNLGSRPHHLFSMSHHSILSQTSQKSASILNKMHTTIRGCCATSFEEDHISSKE